LDCEAYLTDFGIAKIVDTAASHTLSTIAGSLGYMAPGDHVLSSQLISVSLVHGSAVAVTPVGDIILSRQSDWDRFLVIGTATIAEYSFSARVNEKIDIYSFGVVLLELVTGKRAIDPSIYGEAGTNLVHWVTEKVQTPEGVYEILDPNCESSSQEDMVALLRIGILCTSFMPARRPSMQEVVTLLADIAPESCVNSDFGKDGSEEGFHDSKEK